MCDAVTIAITTMGLNVLSARQTQKANDAIAEMEFKQIEDNLKTARLDNKLRHLTESNAIKEAYAEKFSTNQVLLANAGRDPNSYSFMTSYQKSEKFKQKRELRYVGLNEQSGFANLSIEQQNARRNLIGKKNANQAGFNQTLLNTAMQGATLYAGLSKPGVSQADKVANNMADAQKFDMNSFSNNTFNYSKGYKR